jgi:hypothetical protein
MGASGWVCRLAAATATTLIGTMLVGCEQAEPVPTEQVGRDATIAACQHAVEGKLESPDTAEFSSSAKATGDDSRAMVDCQRPCRLAQTRRIGSPNAVCLRGDVVA